ncbi:hypothetical protein F5Y06DRAFT_186489 [Hypoxylon sp. FL0890]|nr:hypothetical protein F5Y06DRAFT_186489 [Hypoxylon sp. FL0890]
MASSKGRAGFQADLKSATEKDHVNITRLDKGDADDEFTLVFSHPSLPSSSEIEIRVQPQDIRGYPRDNTFLIYTNHDIPSPVARVLEESIHETMGMRIDNMLSNLSQRLRTSLESNEPGAEDEASMAEVDVSDSEQEDIGSSDEDIPFDLDEDFPDDGMLEPMLPTTHQHYSQSTSPLSPSLLERLRRDLLSVHEAGFSAGRVSGFGDSGPAHIISVSIRVNRLCLSRETREAWYLAPSDYIVLLIRYNKNYNTFDDLMERPAASSEISFRLKKCSKRKTTQQQANAAFTSNSAGKASSEASEGKELSNTCISTSIDDLMNTKFIALLKLRKLHGHSWESANKFFNSQMSGFSTESEGPSTSEESQHAGGQENLKKALINKKQGYKTKLPSFLTVDHLSSDGEVSLPLVALQFALLHLIRCADYCAVCHEKVKGNFEALRPYVCSKPLCLHQYMNLGLGPSIDDEIVNQPYVVDLLISFCYASLFTRVQPPYRGMREFPSGLGLRVPKIRRGDFNSPSCASSYEKPWEHRFVPISGGILVDPVDITFNWDSSIATITQGNYHADLVEGKWVVVSTVVPIDSMNPELPQNEVVLHHARIELRTDKLLQLNVVSRHLMPSYNNKSIADVSRARLCVAPGTLIPGHIVSYDEDLDQLRNDYEKAFSMMLILASLPSVAEMRSYLMRNPLQQLAQTKWNRMTPASVYLLRWIIASNRSYIVQVSDEQVEARSREKICGVDGWMQFRFAQGSPEKEMLFREALEPINKPQKTLLAWHGSSLENWHSIIRQGLDFSFRLNGRAYGNGIYFAREFDYSASYTGCSQPIAMMWPRSSLGIQAAVSLNELVNTPEKFVSSNPYFVVQECHWTQCRYLFVRYSPAQYEQDGTQFINTNTPTTARARRDAIPEFIQDPKWVATGLRGANLFVPKYAIPSARDGPDYTAGSSKTEARELEIDSSGEDEEDINFLFPNSGISHKIPTFETDFRPGTLDLSTLPRLAPPSYATGTSEKALAQEIKKLEQIQSSTPLHRLGWYMDFERITNMFQWIVELHSFEPTLPLAQDMKAAGLTSIVLEIRFLSGFPMTPPFVRVVRPRFLPFMEGGGGHVTAGGAMCMELLTNSGWSPAYSMESVLLQVRMAICSVDPKPARLPKNGSLQGQYGIKEAVDAYLRAASSHGWIVPPELKSL